MSITEISLTVKHPERFCGMHWVNPPHIGKKPVMVKKDAPGFVLNRIQFAVLREALNIVDLGIASYLFADLGSTSEVSPLLGNLVKDGAFGVKSGKGFYDYSDGKDAEAIKNRDIKFLKLAKCLYK